MRAGLTLNLCWRSLFWAMLALVTALALGPFSGPELRPQGSDKINHFMAFLVLEGFGALAYHPELRPEEYCAEHRAGLWGRLRGLLVLGGYLLAYGLSLEVAQSVLPTRTASLGDLGADATGVLAGIVVLIGPISWIGKHKQ